MDILLNLWTFCSTYGHFAQPMHMLLNRWTFCSPYGHPDEHNGRQKAAKRDAISWQAANKGVAGNGFPANPTKHPGRSGARAIKCDQIAKPSNSMPAGPSGRSNGRQKAAKRDAISWQAANKGVAGNGFPANPTKHPGRSGARAIKCDQIAKPSNSMPAKVWWKVQGKV